MKKNKPNLREEKKLWKKGFKRIAGLDEAGRGALAGPVVAAAVTIKNPKSKILSSKQIPNFATAHFQWAVAKFQYFKQFGIWRIGKLKFVSNLKIRDSKRLSPKQREKIYKILVNHPAIEWGIGRVSERVIDKINILEATKLAMKKAIQNLLRKQKIASSEIYDREITRRLDFLILDGKMKLDLLVPQKSIVKADEKVFSCALASILAKVYRDRIMKGYHKKFPQYGFDRHKGYPTRYHFKMLKKYGPCKIHRKSFIHLKSI